MLDHLRQKRKTKLNPELIWKIVKKCKTYTEFKNKYSNAYDKSKKFGIREDIKKYFPKLQYKPNYWTDERIQKMLKNNPTYGEIRKRYSGALNAIYKSPKRQLYLSMISKKPQQKY